MSVPDPTKSGAYQDHLREIAPPQSSKAVNLAAIVTESGCTLWIGVSGDVVVDLMRDAPGTKTKFKGVPVGPFNYRVKTLYGASDGTTATNIVMAW